MQSRNRDPDIKNKLVDTERVGQIETVTQIYTLPYAVYIATGKLLHSTGGSTWCSVMT